MDNNEQPPRGYGPLFEQQRPQPAPKLAQETVEDFWADATVISIYTRAQALADGVLEDASKLAKEAGFTVPVAVTCSLWDRWIDPGTMGLGQSINGRLWDTLQCLRHAIKTAPVGEDRIRFRCIYIMGAQSKLVALKAVCGPGDQGEPVISVMLPEED
jgi:hypothetical protein